jgi:hypothetical protein
MSYGRPLRSKTPQHCHKGQAHAYPRAQQYNYGEFRPTGSNCNWVVGTLHSRNESLGLPQAKRVYCVRLALA